MLADRVAILAAGRIVAEGTPDELGSGTVRRRDRLPAAGGRRASELPGPCRARDHAGAISFAVADPVPVLRALTTWASDDGHDLPGLEVRRPSLEDIYLG